MSKAIPATSAAHDSARVIERPDGYYWQDKTSGQEFGPFATLLEAVEDMNYTAETDFEPAESLQQAEEELGIADWVDPDTGFPAEDSRPHIEDS